LRLRLRLRLLLWFCWQVVVLLIVYLMVLLFNWFLAVALMATVRLIVLCSLLALVCRWWVWLGMRTQSTTGAISPRRSWSI
jgi:hypothetical protein